ncbi:MAG: EAL and HDOD domain-containing protein, partial [Pseudomonadota bacterium]
LEYISASEVICQALLAKKGAIAFFIGTAEALEQANWKAVSRAANKLKLDDQKVMQLYHDAVNWTINLHS